MSRALAVIWLLASAACGGDAPRSDSTASDVAPREASVVEARARDAAADLSGGDRLPADRAPAPRCADGTPVGGCAKQKPLRCNSALKLEHDCPACGCPGLEACNALTKGCDAVTVKLSPTADSYVVEPAPATNHGAEDSLKIGIAWDGETRTFLAFDLAKIPTQAAIEAATLSVQVVSWSGTALPVQIRLVSAPWAEQQVSWSNQPAVKAVPSVPCDLVYGANPIDAKALVAAWLISPTLPYGFRIAKATSDQGSVTLASREHPTASARPTLSITYR